MHHMACLVDMGNIRLDWRMEIMTGIGLFAIGFGCGILTCVAILKIASKYF